MELLVSRALKLTPPVIVRSSRSAFPHLMQRQRYTNVCILEAAHSRPPTPHTKPFDSRIPHRVLQLLLLDTTVADVEYRSRSADN